MSTFKETSTAPADDSISWKRINNDANGNPRYVCHFLNLLKDGEGKGVDEKYSIALARAKKIGGRKFHNKQYGGGIVFQSYNLAETEKRIKELVNEPKADYFCFYKRGSDLYAVLCGSQEVSRWTGNVVFTGYAHNSQHCNVARGYIQRSRKATQEEYKDLLSELKSVGYNPKVAKRLF